VPALRLPQNSSIFTHRFFKLVVVGQRRAAGRPSWSTAARCLAGPHSGLPPPPGGPLSGAISQRSRIQTHSAISSRPPRVDAAGHDRIVTQMNDRTLTWPLQTKVLIAASDRFVSNRK
jgi:hypothetical protein